MEFNKVLGWYKPYRAKRMHCFGVTEKGVFSLCGYYEIEGVYDPNYFRPKPVLRCNVSTLCTQCEKLEASI